MSEFWIVPPLKAKDSTVNLAVVPAFGLVASVLKTAWIMQGSECVVTSAKDGKHSAKSAHYAGKAMDLRINNLGWTPGTVGFRFGVDLFAQKLARALVESCGPEWYVVLEKDHIHLEYAEGIPNIKGWKAGVHYYDGVKE
jgi:hypothetical protein